MPSPWPITANTACSSGRTHRQRACRLSGAARRGDGEAPDLEGVVLGGRVGDGLGHPAPDFNSSPSFASSTMAEGLAALFSAVPQDFGSLA